MKTIKKLSILFLVALFITSCGKLDITPDDKNDSKSSATNKVSGSMKATIDGKAWEAKTFGFGGISALKTVFGKIDDGNEISLQFIDTKLEINKVYQFDNKNLEPNLNGNVVLKVNNQGLFAESGTFKITKYVKGKEIQGEMNAEFTDFIDKKASIKNCTFSMKY
jgi:hypothetical protein